MVVFVALLFGSARVHLVTKPVRRCYLSSLAGAAKLFQVSLVPARSHGCISKGRGGYPVSRAAETEPVPVARPWL